MYNLAIMLIDRAGLDVDIPRAISLYEKAIALQHTASMYNLEICYLMGKV